MIFCYVYMGETLCAICGIQCIFRVNDFCAYYISVRCSEKPSKNAIWKFNSFVGPIMRINNVNNTFNPLTV